MNGPSAVDTALNSGWPQSTSTWQRGDVLDPGGRVELQHDLLTVERRRALAGERPARDRREVGRGDERLERRELRRAARRRGRSAASSRRGPGRRARGSPSCHTVRSTHMPPRSSTVSSAPGAVEAAGAAQPATIASTATMAARIASGCGATGHGRATRRAADRFRAATVPHRCTPPIIGACPSCAAGSTPGRPRRARTTTRWRPSSPTSGLARRIVAGRGAGGDERSIARHRERGKLPVRERIERLLDPGSAFLELSPLAATGLYDDDAPGRRDRHRDRADRGDDLRRRRQRRHGQGRHLLPDDGEEAPPGPGDRAREPAAVRLPRRLGRRVPAAPGGRLPGSRPLRPDLLQPGPDVGRRDPAGRARDGLVARPAARTSRR